MIFNPLLKDNIFVTQKDSFKTLSWPIPQFWCTQVCHPRAGGRTNTHFMTNLAWFSGNFTLNILMMPQLSSIINCSWATGRSWPHFCFLVWYHRHHSSRGPVQIISLAFDLIGLHFWTWHVQAKCLKMNIHYRVMPSLFNQLKTCQQIKNHC